MPQLDLCKLRPMVEQDLEQVLIWRNSERVRLAMYTDHVITLPEHLAWFKHVSTESNSFNYVFEYDSRPVGVVTVKHIDKVNRNCHWGFYIGESGLPRGTATAMGFMAIEEIIGNLDIRKIIGEVISTNLSSIKYHLRLGFVQEGILRKHVLKKNEPIDVVTFGLLDNEWNKEKSSLEETLFEMSEVL